MGYQSLCRRVEALILSVCNWRCHFFFCILVEMSNSQRSILEFSLILET